MHKYLAKCLDAKYDEPDQTLVLMCLFKDFGEIRIVCFSKSDFHYKSPENEVPDQEMHRTADLWKGKSFYISIDDDPNRVKIDEQNHDKYLAMFKDRINKELEDVWDGLKDDNRILQRYVGDLVEKEKSKTLNVDDMIKNESEIRKRLSVSPTAWAEAQQLEEIQVAQ